PKARRTASQCDEAHHSERCEDRNEDPKPLTLMRVTRGQPPNRIDGEDFIAIPLHPWRLLTATAMKTAGARFLPDARQQNARKREPTPTDEMRNPNSAPV